MHTQTETTETKEKKKLGLALNATRDIALKLEQALKDLPYWVITSARKQEIKEVIEQIKINLAGIWKLLQNYNQPINFTDIAKQLQTYNTASKLSNLEHEITQCYHKANMAIAATKRRYFLSLILIVAFFFIITALCFIPPVAAALLTFFTAATKIAGLATSLGAALTTASATVLPWILGGLSTAGAFVLALGLNLGFNGVRGIYRRFQTPESYAVTEVNICESTIPFMSIDEKLLNSTPIKLLRFAVDPLNADSNALEMRATQGKQKGWLFIIFKPENAAEQIYCANPKTGYKPQACSLNDIQTDLFLMFPKQAGIKHDIDINDPTNKRLLLEQVRVPEVSSDTPPKKETLNLTQKKEKRMNTNEEENGINLDL